MKRTPKQLVKNYMMIVLGCAIYALAFDWCFEPNAIGFGGITGLAQIVNFLFPRLTIGFLVILFNVPLFLIGWRLFGNHMLISSITAMAVSSLMLDAFAVLIDFPPIEDRLLACITRDYAGHLLFFFANGKAARVELSAYQTQTRRTKLTGAYSDKSPLVGAFDLAQDRELALGSSDGRCLIFHTAVLSPKTTRNTQGVNVMTLKAKRALEWVRPLEETAITDPVRYRAKSLPVMGALLKPEDRGEKQLSLLEE